MNKLHENYYDYSKVNYTGKRNKILIICKIHGLFTQLAGDHMRGSGCSKCARKNVNKKISLTTEEFRGKSVKINGKRFNVDAIDEENKIIWEFNGDFWHGNPDIFDPKDFNKIANKTFEELYNKTLSKQKFLETAGYKVISIWESDFKKENNNEI